jgi:hypothetical protein
MIIKILLKAGVERKILKKALKCNEKNTIKKLRRNLLKPSNDVEVIMDDESYFAISHLSSFC